MLSVLVSDWPIFTGRASSCQESSWIEMTFGQLLPKIVLIWPAVFLGHGLVGHIVCSCGCSWSQSRLPHTGTRGTQHSHLAASETHPTSILLALGRARFITWCLRHHFFRECWQGPRHLWNCCACADYSPVLGSPNEKGLVPYTDIRVSEFELQSLYYIHFWTNTLGRGMNPNYRLNRITTVLHEWFWH